MPTKLPTTPACDRRSKLEWRPSRAGANIISRFTGFTGFSGSWKPGARTVTHVARILTGLRSGVAVAFPIYTTSVTHKGAGGTIPETGANICADRARSLGTTFPTNSASNLPIRPSPNQHATMTAGRPHRCSSTVDYASREPRVCSFVKQDVRYYEHPSRARETVAISIYCRTAASWAQPRTM